MTCLRSYCQLGMKPGFQAGCPGPGLGLVCDKAFGGTENGVWTLTRPLEYRGWGLDTGKSWTWDPSLQCCQGCVSRRWLRPWPSRMLCCGPVGDREQGRAAVWVRVPLCNGPSPSMSPELKRQELLWEVWESWREDVRMLKLQGRFLPRVSALTFLSGILLS